MAAKDSMTNVDQLTTTAGSDRKLLTKAIKTASPNDAVTLQRLGFGLTALTKAFTTIEKIEAEKAADSAEPIDYDVMGNPIYRRSARRA